MMARRVKAGKEVTELSKREIDVLTWLAAGKRYEQIGELINCKPNAVHQRMKRIMDKLGTNTSAGTVAVAIRNGIIA